MISSVRRMWLSALVSSCLFVLALSAGNEYLPPNKGYNYEPPVIPFPTNHNGNKQTTPPPFRPVPTPQRPTYLPPGPQPTPQPGPAPTPGHHDHHEHHENHDHGDHHHHEPGMPFDFSYQVAEDGNDYSHNAISDGDITRGEYRVALPDGRTQIVKYTADWKNGFNAEVSYEGEARYPDPPAGGYGSAGSGNGNAGYGSNAGSGSYNSGSSSGGQAYVPPSQGGGYQY
ncbi:pro-resilin-like [Trichoplusia ni]|uniref:Pro-resilin-like n=1 Tax=Trichoplusia ni TaxID=7111 RepID=A0A7E5WUY9_TRINI|nr:pro-resilin-like [Trichoplusia ni]